MLLLNTPIILLTIFLYSGLDCVRGQGLDGFSMCVPLFALNCTDAVDDGFFERTQFDEMEIMEIKYDDLEKSKTVYYSWYQK